MSPLLAMIKANLKMSVRNRQALFWNLVFPALFIVLFGSIFGGGNSVSFNVGVSGEPSLLMTDTLAAMESSDAFDLHQGTTQSELEELQEADRDVVLIFGSQPAGTGHPPVQIYYDQTDGPNGQIAVNVARQLLLTAAQGENPVPITETAVSADDVSYIDFLVPGILAMAIMNSGVIGLSTAFTTYREKGILRRIKVTPFPLPSFILARILSQLVIAVAQSVILVGMAMLLFGLTVQGNLLQILFIIVLGGLAFLAIGFAISGIAKNTETAAAYANLVTFPMLFLSGVFFGIATAPAYIRPITRILPLSYLVDALRETMTRGASLVDIWPDLLALVITFAVAMLIAVRFFRWDVRAA